MPTSVHLPKRNKEREAKARMEAEAAQAWNRIQNSPDQAEVRSFMKRYPDASVTLTHAAPRLAALEHEAAEHAEKARAEAAAARAAWDLVKGTNDPAELRDYINKYPDSPFSTREAKARIDLLERQAKDREAKGPGGRPPVINQRAIWCCCSSLRTSTSRCCCPAWRR